MTGLNERCDTELQQTMKKCVACGEEKERTEYFRRTKPGRYAKNCLECEEKLRVFIASPAGQRMIARHEEMMRKHGFDE